MFERLKRCLKIGGPAIFYLPLAAGVWQPEGDDAFSVAKIAGEKAPLVL